MTIRDKATMYRMLAAGDLGNTVPQWFDRDVWRAEAPALPLWGIRSQLAGGCKRMRLNVPAADVYDLFGEWFPHGGGNISPMIDRYAVLRAEVIRTVHAPSPGLNLFYVPPGSPIDPADSWRGSFRNYGRKAHGIVALAVLAQYLWPGDLEDLRELLDTYPEHVIEFSACDRAVGMFPNRNTIVWECRCY